jgi:hypothetical protein
MSDEPFQYSEGKVTIGGTMVTDDFRIDIENDTKSVYGDSVLPSVDTAEVSATMTVDGPAFERWLGSASAAPTESLYTVEMSYSLDPYARRVKGWRQRLRKLWDCFVDDVRFMLGRRRLTHLSMTIPDVRFSPPR